MLRLHEIPYSTNVERITLALDHKGVEAERVMHDPADRSELERLSGQPLVPVLEDGEMVLYDSPVILKHLEERFPHQPLFPADPARRAEVEVFIDWFNRVWKHAPNAIEVEDDPARIAELERELRAHQDVFETLLAGRDWLMGEFGAADIAAWPFLRYALGTEPDDDERFHQILAANLPLDGRPRLAAWIERMANGDRGG
jgi:maleylacetoacetate isomerase